MQGKYLNSTSIRTPFIKKIFTSKVIFKEFVFFLVLNFWMTVNDYLNGSFIPVSVCMYINELRFLSENLEI